MKRLKTFIFVGVILSVLFMIMGVNSSSIYAAQSKKEEYGLKVTMTTDKDDYGKEEKIKATFDFENNSGKTIKEIQLSNEIPEGYTIEENEIKQQIGDINHGEIKQANVTYVPVVKNNGNVADNSSADNKTPLDSGKKMASNNISNTPVSKAAISNSPDVASKMGVAPTTGDTSNVPVWAIVTISASGVAILSYFIIKNKFGGKVLAIILCTGVVGASISGLTISKANAEEIPLYGGYNIRTTVNVDDEQKDLSSDVAFIVSYDEANNVEPDQEGDFTREQWLTELFNNLELEEWSSDYDLFDDVEEAENKNIINTLIFSEIVSVTKDEYNMDYIYPKNILTRNYLANTLNKALAFSGYEDIDTSSWIDLNDIENINSAKATVSAGIFMLEDNHFFPEKKVTKNEYERAKAFLKEMSADNTDETNEIVYKKNVPVTEATAYTIDTENKKITVYDKTISYGWQVGELHVLVDNKNHTKDIGFRIIAIDDKDDTLVYTYEEPALDEVIESININRHEAITEFIPAEGVELLKEDEINWSIDDSERDDIMREDIQTEQLSSESNLFIEETDDTSSYEKYSRVLASVDDIHVADIDEQISLNGSFNFSVKLSDRCRAIISFDDLAYNLNIRGEPFVNYINSTIEDKVKIKIVGSMNFVRDGGRVKLGDIPFPTTIPGINGAMSVYLVFNANGKIGLSFSLSEEMGFRYNNGLINPIYRLRPALGDISGEINSQFGGELSLSSRLLNMFDLAEIGAEGGGKTKFYGKTGFINGFCLNGSITPYCSIGGKILGNENLSFSIDHDFSDKSLSFHLEESGLLEKCSRSNGYSGKVVNGQGRAIAKAKIELFELDGFLRHKVKSDYEGKFTGGKAATGNYYIIISAPGYKSQRFDNVTIIEGSTLNLGTITLLKTEELVNIGSYSVAGKITNATNNSSIDGAKVSAISTALDQFGDVISSTFSDASGNYKLNVNSGSYKIEVEKADFVTGTSNVTVNNNIYSNDYSLSPSNQTIEGGNLRIVLRWGESPSDLDSHFIGSGIVDPFHVFYSDMQASSCNLDVDDTDSYGPETITLSQTNDGIYRYYVHDYSNRYLDNSTAMNKSGAYVEVYSGNRKINTFRINDTKNGTLWHVFDYNAITGRLTFVDEYSYEEEPYNVGNQLGGGIGGENDDNVKSMVTNNSEDENVVNKENVTTQTLKDTDEEYLNFTKEDKEQSVIDNNAFNNEEENNYYEENQESTTLNKTDTEQTMLPETNTDGDDLIDDYFIEPYKEEEIAI